jgi:hypothetical protein
MTRLVQIKKDTVRRVALVEEPCLHVLDGCNSVYERANSAIVARLKSEATLTAFLCLG